MNDPVNHPDHYGGKDNPYETVKVLEAKLTPEEFRGFCKGNVIKYLDRASYNESYVTDCQKAEWYLHRMNEYMKKKNVKV